MTEESLFHQALAKPAAERAAFLDAACSGQPALRAAVDALLAAHGGPGHPLDRPLLAQPVPTGDFGSAPEPIPTSEIQSDSLAGAVIAGRYTLLDKIGEGGMGEVWVARQTEPVKRRVALKLIKAGMDSKSVLTRFEQERQALAMMDHPNIAKVLDGGLTDDRRPFFVMELVNGLPLTKFCDEMKLGIRERLGLFIPICQAVQHAHQKGIVHRDLKVGLRCDQPFSSSFGGCARRPALRRFCQWFVDRQNASRFLMVQNGTFRLKGLGKPPHPGRLPRSGGERESAVDPGQQALFDEMTTFPVGEHDDLLEAAATETEYLLRRREPQVFTF